MSRVRAKIVLLFIGFTILTYIFFLLINQAKLISLNQDCSLLATLKTVLIILLLFSSYVLSGFLGYIYYKLKRQKIIKRRSILVAYLLFGPIGFIHLAVNDFHDLLDHLSPNIIDS